MVTEASTIGRKSVGAETVGGTAATASEGFASAPRPSRRTKWSARATRWVVERTTAGAASTAPTAPITPFELEVLRLARLRLAQTGECSRDAISCCSIRSGISHGIVGRPTRAARATICVRGRERLALSHTPAYRIPSLSSETSAPSARRSALFAVEPAQSSVSASNSSHGASCARDSSRARRMEASAAARWPLARAMAPLSQQELGQVDPLPVAAHDLERLLELLFRAVEVAVQERAPPRHIPASRCRLRSSRAPCSLRTRPGSVESFARFAATRVRPSAKPAAGRLALGERELLDERVHLHRRAAPRAPRRRNGSRRARRTTSSPSAPSAVQAGRLARTPASGARAPA